MSGLDDACCRLPRVRRSTDQPNVCWPGTRTKYSYDGLNRLTQTQRPTSASNSTPVTTGYAYEGDKTTITDANQNAKYLTYDANGWLRSTEDATGYTVTLSYDAAGSHTGTSDSLGTTLWSGSVAYGMSPFTVAATDADLGAWTYTFDALGELTAWKDAKGQTFSAKYDFSSVQPSGGFQWRRIGSRIAEFYNLRGRPA